MKKLMLDMKFFLRFFKNKYLTYIFILVLVFIATGAIFIYPYLYSEILRLAQVGKINEILNLFIFMIIMSCILYIIDYMRYKLYYTQNNNVVLECKSFIYSNMLDSNLNLHQHLNDSEILNRIEVDLNDIVNSITEMCISILTHIFSIFTLIIIMLNLFPEIATMIIIISAVMGIVTVFYGKVIYTKKKVLLKKVDINTMFLWETLKGISDILTLGVKNSRKKVFREINQEVNNDKVNLSMNYIVSSKILELLGLISIILVYVIGSHIVIKYNKYSIEIIVAMAGYTQLFISYVTSAVNINIETGALRASIDRLKELLIYLENVDTNKESSLSCINHINKIDFDNVNFAYANTDKILNDVSFSIEKGQKVAIIGENGCGKSTILKLLLKYYDSYEGRILINSIEISSLSSESYYRKLTVVNQNPILFNGTVNDNLKDLIDYSDKKRILLEILGLTDEFLEKQVGFMGENLSSGERQKVAILRSFLGEYDLYVLDEINNHLDYKTLKNLSMYIESELEDKTIICITHNKSGLEFFNKIISLVSGEVDNSYDYHEIISTNDKSFA